MNKKAFTEIATAALITTAGITVSNHIKSLNITGSGDKVQAAASQQAQQFIDKAAPAATSASSKYGTYTSVMIAQAAVESGWGQSTLAKEPNNNLFGIKGSYNGQSVAMKTDEYGSNGYYTTTSNFRKYPSYKESFEDNGALIRQQMGSYYSGAWVENAKTPEQATQNGLQGKYATAPNYAKTLNAVIEANNLKQYDPQTTYVNETRTVVKTTPLTNAPVDSDVGKQIGTARVGQQLNVFKYITYGNGVKHAYTNAGWINNTAFENKIAQKPITQTPAKKPAATKPVVQKPKPVVKKKKAKKKAYTYVKTNEIVKVLSAPEGGAPVLKSPNGRKTGQKLPLNSRWKVSGYAVVSGTRYNRVGLRQWLSTEYTDAKKVEEKAKEAKKPVSLAPVSKKETKDEKKTEVKTTKKSTKTKSSYEKVIGNFKVIAENVDVWSSPNKKTTGQLLPANSSWKITGKKTSKGKTWYRLGKSKWVSEKGIKVEKIKAAPVSQAPAVKKTKKKASYPVYESSGVVTVNYKPDYGIVVWSEPGKIQTTKVLKTGTSWRFFKIAIINGEKWYNLGGKQWVPAKYLLIR